MPRTVQPFSDIFLCNLENQRIFHMLLADIQQYMALSFTAIKNMLQENPDPLSMELRICQKNLMNI